MHCIQLYLLRVNMLSRQIVCRCKICKSGEAELRRLLVSLKEASGVERHRLVF
jgi:hypothetical protein